MMSNISRVKNHVADSMSENPWLADLAFPTVTPKLSILNRELQSKDTYAWGVISKINAFENKLYLRKSHWNKKC